MEAKHNQLKKATADAEGEMLKTKEALQDSEKRLNAAKELLRNMDPEDQKKIKVTDTKLPELLELYSVAKEAHSVSQNRYETNLKYVKILEEKIAK
jgi:hypothetical protein